jgi:beta-glucuronidase
LILILNQYCFAQDSLLQNCYLREGMTPTADGIILLDVCESGYYNHRREPHDASENPGVGAFLKRKTQRQNR